MTTLKNIKLGVLTLLSVSTLFSYNEIGETVKNHLDSVSFTPIEEDSGFLVGFDQEDKTVSLGFRLKTQGSFLFSVKEGLFGTVGSEQLDFSSVKTNYVSYIRDRERYSLEASLGFSSQSEILSSGEKLGQVNDVLGYAIRATYNVFVFDKFTMDLSYSLPMIIAQGTATFEKQNCYTDEYNKLHCSTITNSLVTKLPQQSLESRFSLKITNNLSASGYFEYVKNVSYTEEVRKKINISLSYSYDLNTI